MVMLELLMFLTMCLNLLEEVETVVMQAALQVVEEEEVMLKDQEVTHQAQSE